MKQAIKKWISITLVAVMLLASVPLAGFVGLDLTDVDFTIADAAETVLSGNCGAEGDNVTFVLDSAGTLTISGTGAMEDYEIYIFGLNTPWNKNNASIRTVIIEDGVTSIGDYAFEDCTSLASITLPDCMASIGDYAFEDCTSLASITLPDSLTSIGDWAFYGCTSLASITLPDSLTSIGDYAFRNCTSLASITLPDSLTSIGERAFFGCASLASITLPDSVTSIGDRSFYGCTSLESITVDENNTNYSSVGGVLYNKEQTTLIQYPAGRPASTFSIPASVTSIVDDAFRNCTSLASITLPDSLTSIGGSAFWNCTSLTSITLPENLTSIGPYAFEGCTSLASITLPDSITSIPGGVFGDTAYYKNEANWVDGVLYIGNHLIEAKEGLSGTYTVKDGTKTIADDAFYNCISLTSITLPDSLTSIGEYAFYGCTSLASITLPENLTSIGDSAFSNCTSLASITIPDSVTYIGPYAFEGCVSLTNINIPDGVTIIEGAAFSGCASLADITLPDSVTGIMSYAFVDCESLADITLPGSVTSIAYNAFSNCTSLASITLPENLTSIGHDAFSGCTSLASITLPENLTSIKNYAFDGCESLADITLPGSVTSIAYGAFSNCTSLASITLPDSLTSIEYDAFSNCPALVIFCNLGSYAEQYAQENEIPYLILNADPFVTLHCSSLTPTAEFTVYGMATPYHDVSIYCDGILLGKVKSGGNGRYAGTVTLPDPQDGKVYTPVAKIIVDDEEFASEPATVTYNSSSATLASLTFTHSYYSYSITPETQNFTGPVVSINSSMPMSFAIDLNGQPETLTVVSTKDGVRKTMPAVYNEYDGKWYASGWFDPANKSYTPGDITLEYNDGKVIEVNFKVKFIVDPSGYVYEAVKSNVLEGVVATIRYKDTEGNAVFWNADEYEQINPQVTKADGYFSWFVPDGEWQVRFTKNGYETTCSEWYTVPPEVTGLYIPMVSRDTPYVEYCNVYADYAEIKFSKYMKIDTVNSTTISFGDYTGTWTAVDREVSGTDESVYYATTFTFTPDTAFSGDVNVSISGVSDYADIAMRNYENTFEIAEPIQALNVSETELNTQVNQNETVTLDAGTAAAGMTVLVKSTNARIANAVQEIELDENGCADVAIKAKAFGTTALQFALVGTALTAEVLVNVSYEESAAEFTPGEDAILAENGYIYTLAGKTADSLLAQASEGTTLVDKDGNALTGDSKIGTNAVLTLSDATQYTIVVLGDANGDSKIASDDARVALRTAVGLENPTGAYLAAAKVEGNDTVSAGDARKILRAAVDLDDPAAWLANVG